MERYFVIYKPYKMLSQFVRMRKKHVLADLNFEFPEGTNAVGRLDDNSEGLLILTNDKKLNALLLKPENEHKRVYWVQVQFRVKNEELRILEEGVVIRLGKEDYKTRPCKARVIEPPKDLPPRTRKAISDRLETEWLELTLIEGKFHQVRKMCAAINHQVLRLLRVSIEDLKLDTYEPGSVKELSKEELFTKLKIPVPE